MNRNKYEGHTPGPWRNAGAAVLSSSGEHVALCKTKDAPLLTDAPALLAHCNRLAEALRAIQAMTDEDTGTFRKRGGTYRGLVGNIASAALAEYEKESGK